MLKIKTLPLLVLGIFIYLSMTLAYWFFQKDYTFNKVPVGMVDQVEGESVVVDVPIKRYIGLDHFYLYTKIIDLSGNILRQTDPIEFDVRDQYKVLTYSKLPPGNYNVVINVAYKINPIVWKQQEFTLVVLKVGTRPKETSGAVTLNVFWKPEPLTI